MSSSDQGSTIIMRTGAGGAGGAGATDDTATLRSTELDGLRIHRRGKVRDIYDAGERHILIVATDRVSAFDVVMLEGIPRKGEVLTGIAAFFFDKLREICPNHLITTNVDIMPERIRVHRDVLAGRAMLVRRAKVFPIECIVRGHLARSVYPEYEKTGMVGGVKLPPGIPLGGELPEPIFTPTTKAQTGHDEPIGFDRVEAILGRARAWTVRETSMALFKAGAAHARACGLRLCDTKFELGEIDGHVVVVDEVLTPDSSRYWRAADWAPGKLPEPLDKQVVRDYLLATKWDKKPPPPPLPEDVVRRARDIYLELHRTLTGRELPAAHCACV